MTKISLPDDLADGREGMVIYQVYTQTFQDSNNDGIGDIPGVTKRLNYIAHLGVDALMLAPLHPTPDDPAKADGGYSVTDWRRINPNFGTNADFDKLIATAREKNLGVIMDPVVCHTSTSHEWFEKSRQKEKGFEDFYVWHPGVVHGTGETWKPDSDGVRVEPNNWLSFFGGPAWKMDPVRNEYFLHNFNEDQAQLNLNQVHVQDALFKEIKYWVDRCAPEAGTATAGTKSQNKTGLIGIRLDAIPVATHDPNLQNNDWLVPCPYDRALETFKMQRTDHNIGWPATETFLANARKFFGPDFYLFGECIAGHDGGANGLPIAASYRNSLSSSYTDLSIPYVFDDAWELRNKALANKQFFPNDEYCMGTGTHDVPRFPNRMEKLPGEPKLREAALRQEMFRIYCEPGDKILYNGDELGMTQANVPKERQKDFQPNGDSRDGARTPFMWHTKKAHADASNGGFTAHAEPWLPAAPEHLCFAAASQEHCAKSTLRFSVEAIQWRKKQPALVKGQKFVLDNDGSNGDGDIYGFIRASKDQTMLLLFNRSHEAKSIDVRHYLDDGLIKKLGLEAKPVIDLGGYGTSVAGVALPLRAPSVNPVQSDLSSTARLTPLPVVRSGSAHRRCTEPCFARNNIRLASQPSLV